MNMTFTKMSFTSYDEVDNNSKEKSNNNKSFSGYSDDTAVFIVLAVTGPIVGSVVGILILLFLIGGIIFFIRR